MRKLKSRERNTELSVDAIARRVKVNDAARLELRVGDRLAHRAHTRGRHMACLQEGFPFVGGAGQHDFAQHFRLAITVGLALFVCCLDHLGPLEQGPKPFLLMLAPSMTRPFFDWYALFVA